jgi:hypothetical protein
MLVLALAAALSSMLLSGCPGKNAGGTGAQTDAGGESAGSVPALPDSSSTPEQTASQAGAAMAKLATDFNFSTLDGKAVKLSDYAGKPLVLNFWATW